MSKISAADWVKIYDRSEWLPDRRKRIMIVGEPLSLVCEFTTDMNLPMGRYDTKYDGVIQPDRAQFVQGTVGFTAEFRGKTTEIIFDRAERLQFGGDYKQVYTKSRYGYGIHLATGWFGREEIPDEDLTFIKLAML